MDPLPIDSFLRRIVDALRAARGVVVVAPPGAGKTTRVPPAILRAGLLGREHPNLVMLQPRRVAARAAAGRIAQENGWTLGDQVGYHVRFDRKLARHTPLRVLTEGILTRQLVEDPFLEGLGAVVLDEFHERSLHTDLAIAMLKEIRQTVRPDLLLVVMSATLEAQPVAQFLGGCPIVRAEGRTHPIHIEHRPAGVSPWELPGQIAHVLAEVLSGDADGGDILVFLPGVDEIRRTLRELEPLCRQHDLLLLPLHGSLPADDQLMALRPSDRRKVILATNIAETSLTIDGVRTVIDCGLARVAGYDAQRGLDRLDLSRISKASAIQRAGRAGRTAPGRAIRLYSAKEYESLKDYELPEIQRVDLAATVLALCAWGKPDARTFGWYSPPPDAAVASAERLLVMLGALVDAPQPSPQSAISNPQSTIRITPLGRQMLRLPIHPRLARLMLAAAQANVIEQGAALAALLSEKDIVPAGDRDVPLSQRTAKLQADSDLLVRLELLHQPHADVDRQALRQVLRTRDELLRIARRCPPIQNPKSKIQNGPANGPPEAQALLRLLLLAYPDRVARRRWGDPQAAVMVGGSGLRLARESVVRQGPFFLALDARRDERSPTRESLVRLASRIEEPWLEELLPHLVERRRIVAYDARLQAVVARRVVLYHDLELRSDPDAAPDRAEAGKVLAAALADRAVEIFDGDEPSSRLLCRVATLRQAMPEHPWPAFDQADLARSLADACQGRRSLKELYQGALADALRASLVHPLDRILDAEAPETITVPSGSRIRLIYRRDDPRPILAVRLQEMFGCADTPRIAAGRVKVLLHLLGPNFRPVQVTDDLASFWKNTYPQVRKDLRARYPKHAWPDHPLVAAPQAKGRPRR